MCESWNPASCHHYNGQEDCTTVRHHTKVKVSGPYRQFRPAEICLLRIHDMLLSCCLLWPCSYLLNDLISRLWVSLKSFRPNTLKVSRFWNILIFLSILAYFLLDFSLRRFKTEAFRSSHRTLHIFRHYLRITTNKYSLTSSSHDENR